LRSPFADAVGAEPASRAPCRICRRRRDPAHRARRPAVAPLIMRSRRVLVRLTAAAAATMAVATSALAQPTDVAVKAAFVPRFARYVTWPPAAMPKGSDPFVVCVIGSDPFGGLLQ